MVRVNKDRITQKVDKDLRSDDVQKRSTEYVVDKMALYSKYKTKGGTTINGVIEAAGKFMDCLRQSADTLLPPGVASEIELEMGDVRDNGDGTLSIGINFAGNLDRPSLYPTGYPEGIDNLIALYNNGVDHTMRRVYGIWQGHDRRVGSRTIIPPSNFMSNFIQNAAQSFQNSSDASKYGLIDIVIDEKYEG